MRRWTTPTHELFIEGVDLTGCDVYVTYTQDQDRDVFPRCAFAPVTRTVEVTPHVDEDGTTLYVEWGQEESAMFHEGKIDVQVNWVHPDGKRGEHCGQQREHGAKPACAVRPHRRREHPHRHPHRPHPADRDRRGRRGDGGGVDGNV